MLMSASEATSRSYSTVKSFNPLLSSIGVQKCIIYFSVIIVMARKSRMKRKILSDFESDESEFDLELTSTNSNTALNPSKPENHWCFSSRKGDHWMDGRQLIYWDLARINVRPWDDCIPLSKLATDNLPPYYVRLRDDQVGHLSRWMTLSKSQRFCQYWSLDLTATGEVSAGRKSWGKPYLGEGPRDHLQGGKKLPRFEDLGLPLTHTSSGKIMRESNDESEEKLDDEAGLKRKRNDSEGGEQGRNEKFRTTMGSNINIEDLVDKIDQLIAEIYQKNDQIADISGNNANLEAKIIDLEASIADLKEETHQLGINETMKETEIIRLRANLLAAFGEKERLLAKNVQLYHEIGKLNTDLKVLKKQQISNEAATRALKSLKEQFAKAQDIVDEAQKGLHEVP